MQRNDARLLYRIKPTNTGLRLKVWDPAVSPEMEEAVLEGFEFDTVADVLHFVGVHYPNSKEADE